MSRKMTYIMIIQLIPSSYSKQPKPSNTEAGKECLVGKNSRNAPFYIWPHRRYRNVPLYSRSRRRRSPWLVSVTDKEKFQLAVVLGRRNRKVKGGEGKGR